MRGRFERCPEPRIKIGGIDEEAIGRVDIGRRERNGRKTGSCGSRKLSGLRPTWARRPPGLTVARLVRLFLGLGCLVAALTWSNGRLGAIATAISPAAVEPAELRGDGALGDDSKQLADELGVSIAEAARYLELQPRVGQLEAFLDSEGPASFGGLYIEYDPYGVVVLSTSDDPQGVVSYIREGGFGDLEAFVRIREVDYRMRDIATRLQEIKSDNPDITFSADADLHSGAVTLAVVGENSAKELASRISSGPGELRVATASLPLEIVAVDSAAATEADIYAGLKLADGLGGLLCTSGFSVEACRRRPNTDPLASFEN